MEHISSGVVITKLGSTLRVRYGSLSITCQCASSLDYHTVNVGDTVMLNWVRDHAYAYARAAAGGGAVASTSGATIAGNTSSGGSTSQVIMIPHSLNGALHTGNLGDTQAPQFLLLNGTRAMIAPLTLNLSAQDAPFVLGTNAAGQLCLGLNADLIDGLHAAEAGSNAHAWATDSVGDAQLTGSLTVEQYIIGLFDIHAMQSLIANGNVNAGMDVNAGVDVNAVQDINAARDVHAAQDAYVTRQLVMGEGSTLATVAGSAGALKFSQNMVQIQSALYLGRHDQRAMGFFNDHVLQSADLHATDDTGVPYWSVGFIEGLANSEWWELGYQPDPGIHLEMDADRGRKVVKVDVATLKGLLGHSQIDMVNLAANLSLPDIPFWQINDPGNYTLGALYRVMTGDTAQVLIKTPYGMDPVGGYHCSGPHTHAADDPSGYEGGALLRWTAREEEPEWTSTVMVKGPGEAHDGSLLPYSDDTANRNAYAWSANAADQTIDLVYRWRLGDDFVQMGPLLSLASYSTAVAEDSGTYLEVLSFTNPAGANALTPAITRNAAWAETEYPLNPAVPFVKGDRVTLRVRLHADMDETLYLGNLKIPYQHTL